MLDRRSEEFLKDVLYFLPRIERLRLRSMCKGWQDIVTFDSSTWSHVACCRSPESRTDLIPQLQQTDALVLRFEQLLLIPDLAFVQILILLEDDKDIVMVCLEEDFDSSSRWPTLSMLFVMRFPCLRAIRFELYSSEHEFMFTEASHMDMLCNWLCGLPDCLEYIDIDVGGFGKPGGANLKEGVKSWMVDHDKVFLGWLPNLKGCQFPGLRSHMPEGPDELFQVLAEDLRILDQLKVLSIQDYFLQRLWERASWLSALQKLEHLRYLALYICAPSAACLSHICSSLPPDLKTLFISWHGSEALALSEWSCFGSLQGLHELCIALDECEYIGNEGPGIISSHLSQLLPATNVLVSSWGEGANQINPPDIMDRFFMPGAEQVWMQHVSYHGGRSMCELVERLVS